VRGDVLVTQDARSHRGEVITYPKRDEAAARKALCGACSHGLERFRDVVKFNGWAHRHKGIEAACYAADSEVRNVVAAITAAREEGEAAGTQAERRAWVQATCVAFGDGVRSGYASTPEGMVSAARVAERNAEAVVYARGVEAAAVIVEDQIGPGCTAAARICIAVIARGIRALTPTDAKPAYRVDPVTGWTRCAAQPEAVRAAADGEYERGRRRGALEQQVRESRSRMRDKANARVGPTPPPSDEAHNPQESPGASAPPKEKSVRDQLHEMIDAIQESRWQAAHNAADAIADGFEPAPDGPPRSPFTVAPDPSPDLADPPMAPGFLRMAGTLPMPGADVVVNLKGSEAGDPFGSASATGGTDCDAEAVPFVGIDGQRCAIGPGPYWIEVVVNGSPVFAYGSPVFDGDGPWVLSLPAED